MNTENKQSKNLVTRISEAIRFQEWMDRAGPEGSKT